ncbi:MAG: hypothetical protein WC798_02735 [Candidatus Paceibacterota bacterium]|jgi:shikimate kinase
MKKHLTLIGMSGAGKSRWCKRLVAEAGYTALCCDDLIEERLAPILQANGFGGIEGVARWMGQPYEPYSPGRQALYLKQEESVMRGALRALSKSAEPLVIDTTGSVIYLGDEILAALRKRSTVVHLNVSMKHREEMYQKYLRKPKPVIWNDHFAPFYGESPEETLARCYPLLIEYRQEQYRKWARVTIGYHERRDPGFDIRAFLKKVRG